jgi:hypothetical protein
LKFNLKENDYWNDHLTFTGGDMFFLENKLSKNLIEHKFTRKMKKKSDPAVFS